MSFPDFTRLHLYFATTLLFASHVLAAPENFWSYAGLAFGLTIGVTAHFVGIMLVASIAAFIATQIAIQNKKIYPRNLAVVLAIPCIIFIVFYSIYRSHFAGNTQNWWIPPISVELISSSAGYIFGTTSIFQFFNEIPVGIILFTLIVLALVANGKWRFGSPFLAAALVYWLQIVIYSIVATPIFWYRTVLPGLIPFVAFVAVQISTIPKKQLQLAFGLVTILLSTLFATQWYNKDAYEPVEPWQEVAQQLAAQWRPQDLVVFYPSYIEGVTRYYFDELPDESIVRVPIGASSKQIERQLDNKLPYSNEGSRLVTVFLVIRTDLSTQKDIQTYQKLLTILKSKALYQIGIQGLMIMSHDNNFQKSLKKTQQQLHAMLSTTNFSLATPPQMSEILTCRHTKIEH